MSEFGRPSMSMGPPAGRVTKVLIIIYLTASLVFSVTERKLGFGVSDLMFTTTGMLNLEFWRIFTYPFVDASPFAVIIGAVILYFFGRFFEGDWGSRQYLRFFLLSSIGAAVLALPLGFLINFTMPFYDTGMASGPDAAFDAMLVALALVAPDSNVLFGFLLPIRAKTLVYIFLGIQLIQGIMTGAAGLAITLGGMAMGYILVTGIWRPERFIHRLKVWTLRKRRRGLYVVPPKKDPTLH